MMNDSFDDKSAIAHVPRHVEHEDEELRHEQPAAKRVPLRVGPPPEAAAAQGRVLLVDVVVRGALGQLVGVEDKPAIRAFVAAVDSGAQHVGNRAVRASESAEDGRPPPQPPHQVDWRVGFGATHDDGPSAGLHISAYDSSGWPFASTGMTMMIRHAAKRSHEKEAIAILSRYFMGKQAMPFPIATATRPMPNCAFWDGAGLRPGP